MSKSRTPIHPSGRPNASRTVRRRTLTFQDALLARANRIEEEVGPDVEERLRAPSITGDELVRYRAAQRGLYFLREAAAFEARRAQLIVGTVDLAVGALTVLATAFGAFGIVYQVAGTRLAWAESVAALLLAFLVGRPMRGQARDRWIKNRFIAEFGRALLQSAPIGVGAASLVQEAASALPAENDPSPVYVRILESALEGVDAPSTPVASEAYAAGVRLFLAGQIEHHERSYSRRRVKDLAVRQVGIACFVVATAVSLTSVAVAREALLFGEEWTRAMQFASILLPVVAASTFLFGVQREYARMCLRSKRMVRVFRKLSATLERASTDEARATAIADVARAHALESYEWSVLMEMSE